MGVDTEFLWHCHPAAGKLVARWLERLVDDILFAGTLRTRMREETGTRLVDWVDHLVLPRSFVDEQTLREAGFELAAGGVLDDRGNEASLWQHAAGMFPAILIGDHESPALFIAVESVADFLSAQQIQAEVMGLPRSPLRLATVATTKSGRFGIVERHGSRRFVPEGTSPELIVASLVHHERFRQRPRHFGHARSGFEHASGLFEEASQQLGKDWACDLFFSAEREYWQSRNRAARVQRARQDRLGLGWANHDHHTYRSSREHFASLIALLEQMGFQARERFYGGAEAGWGAQVMEQPNAGVVVFADVDLTPQEVTGDFAHQGLPPRDELGTVGLWCALHGEAMLEAGLHHLECQFDFEAARAQLADEGIVTMPKFTDFDFLKQAFTAGEIWQISEARIEAALARGALNESQANRFREQGTIGSHLEILQRDDGYKGFNQTGISEIIRETDPRHALDSFGG